MDGWIDEKCVARSCLRMLPVIHGAMSFISSLMTSGNADRVSLEYFLVLVITGFSTFFTLDIFASQWIRTTFVVAHNMKSCSKGCIFVMS